jgi:short-subunit dehydrogenase
MIKGPREESVLKTEFDTMTKYLVITGGSRGIGEATVAQFVEDQWKVINISRTPCKIPGVTNFSVDLANPENIEKIAPQLNESIKDASTICLVHNAGFQTKDTVECLELKYIKETFNVNVISSSLLNKIIIPKMKPGSSIFI